MKNSNDTIGNRTRDLPACSAVPQPTVLPAACPHCMVSTAFNFMTTITLTFRPTYECNRQWFGKTQKCQVIPFTRATQPLNYRIQTDACL